MTEINNRDFYLASDKKTAPETLDKLSGDKDRNVRLRVAENTSTPVLILEKLSGDENENVREAVHQNCINRGGYTKLYMDTLKDEDISLIAI